MIARIQQSMKEKDQGFTLIELLVVIIIIGILAAIAIPVFLNQRERAIDSGIESDLRNIATNVETSFVDNQAYPANADVTQAGVGGDVTIVGIDPIPVSHDNTTIAYATVAGGFTLTATNPDGADAQAGIVYDSTDGGLG
ncbi:prepilin-type N-terminal cleavage/methylation domain-containing protein [Demequina sp. NBRC 110053]|uniref:prepilin-type N-terminal cleavage/methylation domain-containing protein n=1 Tax=Demequina sp. NBRC 110053 TaxID=1570342 RepID=UPI000A073EC7|nr:prepilin-type N-terminal cleavage/methylation domain-containing protein [Demequina sp. NBRC 110053]